MNAGSFKMMKAHRPSMSEVDQILEGITEVNLPPILRFIYFYNDKQDDVIFFTKSPSRKSSHAQSNVSIAFPWAKSAKMTFKILHILNPNNENAFFSPLLILFHALFSPLGLVFTLYIKRKLLFFFFLF